MIDPFNSPIGWTIGHWVQIKAILQAFFCGGIAYLIAFRFQRGAANYYVVPSLCAFGIASLMAQQWLSLVGRVLMYGEWPDVSIYNTLFFALIFVLLKRAKGNVSRMFNMPPRNMSR